MPFETLLSTQNLRNAILNSNIDDRKRYCISVARLTAAYYLGLPLFEPNNELSYPTLFLWTQLNEEEITGLHGVPLSRESIAAIMPAEFSPRLPIVLLTMFGLSLEAVLYSDYFDDRRSSLLLRIFIDHHLSLELTEEYIRDFRLDVLPRMIETTVTRSTDYPNLSTTITQLCYSTVDSLLELDVILGCNYLLAFESEVIEKIEFLFAQLPVRSEEAEHLPRAPVYSLPEYQSISEEDYRIHLKMHIYLRILLSILHKTNRLNTEIAKAMGILQQDEQPLSSYSVLARLIIIILVDIYRDSFTISYSQQWPELGDIALKYQALLDDESKDVRETYKRWYSLCSEQDLAHVNMFFQFLRQNFTSQTCLPSLTPFTREIWYKNILERTEEDEEKRMEEMDSDWLSGMIKIHNKVPSEIFDRMTFISSHWTSFSLRDPSLIPLRLSLSPLHLCIPNNTVIQSPRSCLSARESSTAEVEVDETRLFSSRDDLISIYAAKGREYFADKYSKKKKEVRRAKYLKHTIRDNIQQAYVSQRELERELETERRFLAELQKPSTSQREIHEIWNKSISNDISRLNNKLQSLSMQLKGTSTNSSTPKSQRTENTEEEDVHMERVTEIQPTEEEDEDEVEFDYEDAVNAVDALPQIEKLDLSVLSTPIASLNTSGKHTPSTITEKALETAVNFRPDWMNLLPLEERQTDRPYLLIQGIKKPLQRTAVTERDCQTELIPLSPQAKKVTKEEDVIENDYSNFITKPLNRLVVKPLSKMQISDLLAS